MATITDEAQEPTGEPPDEQLAVGPDRAKGQVRGSRSLPEPSHRFPDKEEVASPTLGWTLLFADQHPYAGGEDHYAAYLANSDGYEVELIANSP